MNRKRLHHWTKILLLSCFIIGNLFAQKGPKDKFDFPPLGKINMPEVHEVTLDNGMRVFFVEDHEYPTIDMFAMIRTGSIFEIKDKIGLAEITGSVIRTGGSTNISCDALDDLLETMGATVETFIGDGSGGLVLSLFKNDIDKGLDILAHLLMNPAFPQDKIDLAKIERRSLISRRNDNVGAIMNREFQKLIYGGDNPWARHIEYATVDAITRDDLVAFHKKYY